MAFNNDQDASALNIHNLDSRYKQYSQTLNELRDPNNLSYTNSNMTNGVESVNTNSLLPNVQQGPDLKEQLLNIIANNAQSDNLKQVTFKNVQTTTFVDDIDEIPIEEAKVTLEPMPPLHSLTTDISKTLSTQNAFDPNFNFVEEGHFHREKPQAKPDNLNRVRSRLLLDQKDSYFFDITGELKNDAPTLRHVPPSFLNDPCARAPFDSDESSLVYLPASMWTIENSNVARHIRAEISKIRFTSHELSSDQDLLSNQLLFLYDSCMNDIKFPKTEYFMQKISALREELKHHPDREKEIIQKIVECHDMRDLEEKKISEKRNSLLECWHMLKEVREKSKPTTKVCLRWKAKKFSEEEKHKEEVLFDQDIQERAQEIKKYNELFDKEEKDINEIIDELIENHKEMGLRMPGETKWIPTLAESTKADIKELSSQEQNRFKRLAKTKVSVGFYMGVYEVLSDEINLDLDFSAILDVGCHAIALHVPPSIKVHIFESGSSKRHEIASVTIPVFNGEPPDFTEYEFTSIQPLSNGRIIQGYLEARCFVQTDSESLETIIKDTRDQYVRKETAVDKVKKRPVHMSTKLMTELVNKHDPNDPYLTSAIATMKAHRFNESDDKKFHLDTHSDSTLFASMAASDIWKQIPNRAYDLIRPSAENQNLNVPENDRLKLYDVITQPPAASFSTFFKSLFGIFRRKKKSRNITSREANISHRIEERSTILLHIHQILLTPLRCLEYETVPSLKEGSTQPKEKTTTKTRQSSILVRISLQGAEHASAIVRGNPEDFNQQVELRLVKEGETVPDYKQIEGKTIRIDIFDEYSKEELQFIGTLQIPLRSVFINGQISGTFSITSPHFTMDHEIPDKLSKLSISICLKPRLVFERNHLPSPVIETEEINDRAHNIWNTLRTDFPNREYNILIMTTLEGKQDQERLNAGLLPCRMATQQSITEIQNFEELLAFVSMIPTNSTIEKQDKTAWSTSDEVIQNNSGTNIEHALLFCNLLLGKDIDAYVVLGNDLISGYDAYVLVIDDNKSESKNDDYLKSSEDEATKKKRIANRAKEIIKNERLTLINPTNGRLYRIDNEDITLFDVSTVFNHKNVWFNIQNHNTPLYEMNWNLYNPKAWISFFDSNFNYVELKSPQPTDLEIFKINEERIRRIKKKVKQIIEETVESLRPKTKWVISIKENLKQILIARKDIESGSHDVTKSKSFGELMRDTIQKFSNYRIVGSPFFISYVYDGNANDGILRNEIFDEIKKREICSCYLTEDGKEETQETLYSHAVEIKAYPNEIYAIWVLLVALHPKQPREKSSRVENNESDNKKDNDKNDNNNKNDESEYSYYYEEEEEEKEVKRTRPGRIIIHSDEIEEDEYENDNIRKTKSKSKHSSPISSSKKSRHESPNSSTRKSRHESPNSSINKSKHGSPNSSTRKSRHESPNSSINKSKQESLNSSTNKSKHESPNSSTNKSKHESPNSSINKSKHDSLNSSMNKSKHDSLNSSMNKSKQESLNSSMNKSKHDSLNSSMNKSKHDSPRKEDDNEGPIIDIIEEEEEADSDSDVNETKTQSKSLNSSIKTITITKTEEIRKERRRRVTKVKKSKTNADGENSESDSQTHSSVVTESSSYSTEQRQTENKVLMLGEAPEEKDDQKENKNENESKSPIKSENDKENKDEEAAQNTKNEKENKSENSDDENEKSDKGTNAKNDDENDAKSAKSKNSIIDSDKNDNDSKSSKRSKSNDKGALEILANTKIGSLLDADNKDDSSNDDDGKKLKSKKLNDDEGQIYQISDISLSVPSQGLVRYRERMKGYRKRNIIYENSSDESDSNNDSIYQMKKQAAKKKNAFESDIRAKKRQPTRRRNRINDDDENDQKQLSSPVKNQKKRSTRPKPKENKKTEKILSPILLSSDSEA